MAMAEEGPGPRLNRIATVCALGLLAASCGTPDDARAPQIRQIGQISQISQSGTGAYEAALAPDGDGFAVAWYDTRDGNAEIYLRLVDQAGRATTPEYRLTDTTSASYEPSLQSLGSDFMLAWYEQGAEGQAAAMLGRWRRNGTRVWVREIASNSRNPVLATDGRALFCAWIQRGPDEREVVQAGWWSVDGDALGAPLPVGLASRTTWNLNAAVDSRGAVWVAFDADHATRASELYLARITAPNLTLERLTADDGVDSKYPDVAVAQDGRVALTWHDARDGNDEVYLFTAAPGDLGGEIDRSARRVTTTPGQSIGAYVAWNARRVGLSWSDDSSGQHEVFHQIFDELGGPVLPARQITDTPASALVPAIRPWQNGFALAWNEYAPDPDRGHDGLSEVAFTVVR
jgi:hypothetical protein